MNLSRIHVILITVLVMSPVTLSEFTKQYNPICFRLKTFGIEYTLQTGMCTNWKDK
jgi:hypothetical protein